MMPTGVPEAFQVAEDGTIHVPAFDLPLSAALSPESRQRQIMAMRNVHIGGIPRAELFETDAAFRVAVDDFRQDMDIKFLKPMAERLLEMLPVRVQAGRIADVPVEEFAPLDGADSDRVLINLHGGAFFSGMPHVARIESIPVAHRGKFRVIAVDYRQGYEHKFPAANEDVTAVYSELLKEHPPKRIGIYGGSAGGMLAAQATAWIIEKGLPAPGAIGIFGAGSGGSGDSAYFGAIGMGTLPPYDLIHGITSAKFGYFSEVSGDDYLVNPDLAPESFRRKFPPTLLITGTRAFDFSPAIATHRALVQAGVEASLHVFDGHGHCFYYDCTTTESVDAYQTIIRFFRNHLTPPPPRRRPRARSRRK